MIASLKLRQLKERLELDALQKLLEAERKT